MGVLPDYIYPHAAEAMWTCLKAMRDTVKKWPEMDAIDSKVTAAAAAAPSRARSANRAHDYIWREGSDTTVSTEEETS